MTNHQLCAPVGLGAAAKRRDEYVVTQANRDTIKASNRKHTNKNSKVDRSDLRPSTAG